MTYVQTPRRPGEERRSAVVVVIIPHRNSWLYYVVPTTIAPVSVTSVTPLSLRLSAASSLPPSPFVGVAASPPDYPWHVLCSVLIPPKVHSRCYVHQIFTKVPPFVYLQTSAAWYNIVGSKRIRARAIETKRSDYPQYDQA